MSETSLHLTLKGKNAELLAKEAETTGLTKLAIVRLALFEHFKEAAK